MSSPVENLAMPLLMAGVGNSKLSYPYLASNIFRASDVMCIKERKSFPFSVTLLLCFSGS